MTFGAPIAFLDVAYAPGAAGVACLLADRWTAAAATAQIARRFACDPPPYVPGEFYKRELPLLLCVLDELATAPAILVVDGYVWLGHHTPGLGARLFAALGSRTPVVGVAKSRYRDDGWSTPVLRGSSLRPLLVTAAGIEAAEHLRSMHGPHRIPALLHQARAALGLQESRPERL